MKQCEYVSHLNTRTRVLSHLGDDKRFECN